MSNAPRVRARNAPAPAPQQGRSMRRPTACVAKERTREIIQGGAIFDPEIIAGAQNQLMCEQMTDYFPNNISDTRQIKEKIVSLRVNSRVEHVRSIALAYAFFVCADTNTMFRKYIDELRAERKKQNSRTTDLHLIVEHFISYGSGTEGMNDLNARKLYNRDVQAVKYLISQGIRADRVEVYAQEHGQGLDAWARALNKATSEKATENRTPEEQKVADKPAFLNNKDKTSGVVDRHETANGPDNFEIEENTACDKGSLHVNWVNPDGLINKLVVPPDNINYGFVKDLLLGLDAAYAHIQNELP